jgi:hypothetical protein
VRIKVNMTHGDQMTISNTAIVGGRTTPRIIAGQLSSSDEQAVFEWVALNADALVEYWKGRIDTIQLGQALKRIPSPQRGSASVP